MEQHHNNIVESLRKFSKKEPAQEQIEVVIDDLF